MIYWFADKYTSTQATFVNLVMKVSLFFIYFYLNFACIYAVRTAQSFVD